MVDLLTIHSLDACVIENPVDLFYLTGVHLSKGILVIKRAGIQLFVDGRYLDAAKKKSPFSVSSIEGEVALEGKVGFDSAFVSYDGYLRLCEKYPRVEWVACPNFLKSFRVCKSKREIEALKRAAKVTKEGYQEIRKRLVEGVSEEELAFEFEFFCRKQGASGLSFEPIIAFGENSAYPHYRAGKALLKTGQVVLIDVGAVVDHYRGDMTRCLFFGLPDPKIFHLFQVVKRAQKLAVDAVRPGVKIGTLDRIVREEFRKEGLEELFTHSLGHGIGLETHEYPRIKWDGEDTDLILKPGMVFTIEPGLYKPGLGGIRYEDTLVVTESGFENFYQGLQ